MDGPVNSGSSRDRNILTFPDRVGEIVGMIMVALVAGFFVYLLRENTGFMTSRFGTLETILLYGSFVLAIISPGARAIIGRRDRARPFELASNVFSAVAFVWFLAIFPFDFAHLADPLPAFMKFILSWISNEVGWVIILLAALASIGSAIYNGVKMLLDFLL